ncbi:MAG: hypothetical protein ACP5HU_06620 [Phycisphaerae bacterium]
MWQKTGLLILLAAVLSGCDEGSRNAPSAAPTNIPDPAEARARTERVGRVSDPDRPDVVILRGREGTLEIELLQDGRGVPRRDGRYRLEASPFTIRLRGDTARTSYIATSDFSKTGPLDTVVRPLVISSGSGGIWPGDSLAMMHEDELKIDAADSDFFRQHWIAREGRAEELAGFLRSMLGETPAIASVRHYYLGLAGRRTGDVSAANGGSVLDDETPVADFEIKAIGQRPVGEIPRVRLVIFFQSPIGRTFSQVAWEKFDLHLAEPPEDQ